MHQHSFGCPEALTKMSSDWWFGARWVGIRILFFSYLSFLGIQGIQTTGPQTSNEPLVEVIFLKLWNRRFSGVMSLVGLVGWWYLLPSYIQGLFHKSWNKDPVIPQLGIHGSCHDGGFYFPLRIMFDSFYQYGMLITFFLITIWYNVGP